MKSFDYDLDATAGNYTVRVSRRGAEVLADPLLNKGTAFSVAERDALELRGLLPATVNSMEQQAQRVYQGVVRKVDALEKYIGLAALQDRNEHLFYRVLVEHFEEFLPIVYTPTVGLACKEFSNVFRRGRGLWITPLHKGRIKDVLTNARYSNTRLIVVTDNEAILGIGDQGAGGMAISVGKLALYCAGAGIHPSQTLPISLDLGTNNQALLSSDLYLGYRQPRLSGPEYDELIEEFVDAVNTVFPGTLIQWEDFRKNNALDILERYRHRALSFNDDIQGTGAVALAGIMSGQRISGLSLTEQRVLIYGAGAAGMGIARQLRAGMAAQGADELAQQRAVALMDSRGVLVSRRDLGDRHKEALAWSDTVADEFGFDGHNGRELLEVIEAYKPTVLIGSSGQAGAFSEAVVREMASHCERPMILPFSNPTDCCEAIPRNLQNWTEGRALVATGSPFEPVDYNGRQIHVGQGNNVFIFPGLGLGALIAEASEVTDNMITICAQTLADQVSQEELDKGLLYPAVGRLRDVCLAQAIAVIRQAIDDGVATTSIDEDNLEALVKQRMWSPDYPVLQPA